MNIGIQLFIKQKSKIFKVFKKKLLETLFIIKKIMNENDVKGMQEARKVIAQFLNMGKKKIYFYDHHKCHAYYGYYSSGLNIKKKLRSLHLMVEVIILMQVYGS